MMANFTESGPGSLKSRSLWQCLWYVISITDPLSDELDATDYERFEQIFCCYFFRDLPVQFLMHLQIEIWYIYVDDLSYVSVFA